MSSGALRISLPDRYRVERHVANGGMGAVYAARDEILGRPVAIKVLASHLAEDPVNRARFQREARAAARLSNHPNVVTVYDVGEHDGRPFLVMELMAGGSVAAVLREGCPDLDAALEWLEGSAAALDFAHGEGIVHRDVKPPNLLLDANGRVHVADFGIARIAADETLTSSGQVLGTAAYLSPEQVLGEPATEASDHYALAVVAFELLTGERPFQGEHIAAQARQHVETPPPDASGAARRVPERVDAVLRRGLAKDPAERWPSAGEMIVALKDALGADASEVTQPVVRRHPQPPPRREEPPSTPRRAPAPAAARTPPPPSYTPSRSRSRKPRLLAVAALAALLLAGLAVALLSGGEEQRTAAPTPSTAEPKAKAKAKAKPRPAPATSTPSSASSSSSSSASSAPTGDAAALQARGHALSAGGDPEGAIPVLRQALQATGKSTDECLNPSGACLTYAFALYDLGRALRLAGRPAEAVPVLQQRLRIDNQRGIVQGELAQAQAAAGGGTSGGQEKKEED